MTMTQDSLVHFPRFQEVLAVFQNVPDCFTHNQFYWLDHVLLLHGLHYPLVETALFCSLVCVTFMFLQENSGQVCEEHKTIMPQASRKYESSLETNVMMHLGTAFCSSQCLSNSHFGHGTVYCNAKQLAKLEYLLGGHMVGLNTA